MEEETEETDDIASMVTSLSLDNDPSNEALSFLDGIKIYESFVRAGGLIRSQIESFDNFIINGSHRIITSLSPVKYIVPGNSDENTKSYVEVYFENLVFRPPHYSETSHEFRETQKLFPHEARDRNITYASEMFVDMLIKYPNNHLHKYEGVYIGEMPVMIRSCLCNTSGLATDDLYKIREDPLDEGGYFVVAGKKGNCGERVLMSQERLAYNKVYLFTNRNKIPRFSHYAEIRSSFNNASSTLMQVGLLNQKICVLIQWIPEKNAIPLGVVFLALGIKKEDIRHYILSEDQKNSGNLKIINLLIPTLEQLHEFCSTLEESEYQNAALEYIGKMGKMFVKEYDDEDEEEEYSEIQRRDISENAICYAKHLLVSQFLPHLGNNFSKKGWFLGYMTNLLLTFTVSPKVGTISQDRDHYANKRIQTSGELMAMLFHQAFTKATNDMKRSCEQRSTSGGRSVNAKDHLKPKIFTDTLAGTLISNKWGTQKGTSISQLYERFNDQMMISQRRRLSVPISAEGKVTIARRLHPSSYGFVCIAETPEGKQVGLRKSMTIGTYVTVGSDPEPVIDILIGLQPLLLESGAEIGIERIENLENLRQLLFLSKVFVNGAWECVTDVPEEVVKRMKILKSTDQLNNEVSIVYDSLSDEIRIFTDMGRLVRPLYVVKDGKLAVTKDDIEKLIKGEIVWHDLVSTGKIEIVNAEEQDSSSTLIAMTPDQVQKNQNKGNSYTHCEIHPILLYGAAGALIPYSSHNQSPRNCYSCSMTKQAIGIPGLNYLERNCETQYVLHYPQKPIITTQVSEVLGYNKMPCGQNVIVAIMPFRGYNQEDSIAINKASVERGLFNTSSYVSYTVQLHPFVREREVLGIPDRELCHDITGKVTDVLCRDKAITDGSAEESDQIRMDMRSYTEVTNRHDPVPYAVAKVGSYVERGDVLIGVLKFVPEEERTHQQRPYRNHSVVFNHFDRGQVVKVIYGRDGGGFFFVNVKLVCIRNVEIGDKFSSRHG